MAVQLHSRIQKSQSAARISFIVSLVVLALKFFAFYKTQSTGILSDALETIVNVVTAVVAIIVLKYALEPADEDHPYGHGKLEYFSAAFEGGIILFAAFAIIFESIRSIIQGHEVQNLHIGVFYIILASVINGVVGLYLISVGKNQNSEALKASGAHLLADVKTTAGVIFGLGLYHYTGLKWIDSLIGLLVGLWLGYESIRIIKRNVGGLLDQADVESVKVLAKCIQSNLVEGIIDIHNVRIIRSGSFHHIDAHIVIPEFWDAKKVHETSHDYEKKVVESYKYEGEFAFHADPCYQKYCRVCSVQNCPVRVHPFVNQRLLTEEHIINGPRHTE